jgi:DNA repair photolyase
MDQHLKKPKMKKITSGTREWADYNVNCIDGCFNDCRYCYAKLMANRFGRTKNKSWKVMRVRKDAVVKNYGLLPGRVMFPSSHDIFDFPLIEKACFIVLEKLLKSGNHVLLTTKPRFSIIQKIDKLFNKYKERLQFRFTITSYNDELLKFWEPNAPLFEERMESLKYAFYRKYKTSVSIEPFLDYNPQVLVKVVEHYSTESIWIGKMNYIPRHNIHDDEVLFYNEIRKNYETNHLKDIYNDLKDFPKIRFKDSIRIKLGIK